MAANLAEDYPKLLDPCLVSSSVMKVVEVRRKQDPIRMADAKQTFRSFARSRSKDDSKH